jgi:hypothetical protein
MGTLEPFRAYFQFSVATTQETRYILDGPVRGFLERLTVMGESRTKTIPSGEILWRAQEGYVLSPVVDDLSGGWPAPYGPERKKPLPGRAAEGRANPKGIPHLYLSSDMETAVAEIRPWMGAHVSVGRFQAVRELKVVDFATETVGYRLHGKDVDPLRVQDERIWADVDNAFARPVTRNDNMTDYVPTQIIAEWFKTRGFDGITHRSSIGKGHNTVLFDLKAANMTDSRLRRVTSVEYESEEV